MGLYSISPDREVTQAVGRDQPLLDLGRRRRPPARPQRSRHRARRAHLLHRFDDPLRRARMGGRFDREPRHRPPPRSTIRSDRHDHDRCSTATATPTASAWPMTASRCFFAESWACRIHRYWFDGPKAGTAECVIRDMPGYPDNINRASDGTYWMAWLGMRTPTLRPGAAPSRHAQAHGAARCRRTTGCSPTSTPAASSSSTRRAASSRPSATSPAHASDGHLDARAQGLSLSSAASSTTASAATGSRAPTRTGPACDAYWGKRP